MSKLLPRIEQFWLPKIRNSKPAEHLLPGVILFLLFLGFTHLFNPPTAKDLIQVGVALCTISVATIIVWTVWIQAKKTGNDQKAILFVLVHGFMLFFFISLLGLKLSLILSYQIALVSTKFISITILIVAVIIATVSILITPKVFLILNPLEPDNGILISKSLIPLSIVSASGFLLSRVLPEVGTTLILILAGLMFFLIFLSYSFVLAYQFNILRRGS